MKNKYVRLIPFAGKPAPLSQGEISWPIAKSINGEDIHKFNEFVRGFNSQIARKTLNVVSNTFQVLGLNQIGIKTASLPELDLIATHNPDFLKGYYEDSREVILRNSENYQSSNKYYESLRNLFRKISKRNFETPYIFRGLEIVEDKDSNYGLTLVPGEQFEFFKAPDFSLKNHRRKFSKINPDYSIEFNDGGNDGGRMLYTNENPISRLSFDRGLGLVALWGNLASSYSYGNVISIDFKGVPPSIKTMYLRERGLEKDG